MTLVLHQCVGWDRMYVICDCLTFCAVVYGQEDTWDATSPVWWCFLLQFPKVNHGNWRKVVNWSLFLFSSVSSKIWQMWDKKHCRMVASNVFPWEMHFCVSWVSLALSFLSSWFKPSILASFAEWVPAWPFEGLSHFDSYHKGKAHQWAY